MVQLCFARTSAPKISPKSTPLKINVKSQHELCKKKFICRFLPDGEINDGGILFHEKSILREPFDVENNVTWQFRQLKTFQKVFLVSLVFLLLNSIKLGKQSKQRNLKIKERLDSF